jgi:hypothetical protein
MNYLPKFTFFCLAEEGLSFWSFHKNNNTTRPILITSTYEFHMPNYNDLFVVSFNQNILRCWLVCLFLLILLGAYSIHDSLRFTSVS